MDLELTKLSREPSDASKRAINSSSPSSSLTLPKLLYFQKQGLGGSTARSDSFLPIQLIYPSGKLSLGVPLNNKAVNPQDAEEEGLITISSTPENTGDDKLHRNGLRFMFIFTAVFNIIITVLMYNNASVVDQSRLETNQGPNTVFGLVPKDRSNTEHLGFVCTLIITALGILSSFFESSFGLSIYNYSIVVNFILGVCTLPFFGYGFRYFLDLLMVYLAFVHKDHLEATYLPVHVHAF